MNILIAIVKIILIGTLFPYFMSRVAVVAANLLGLVFNWNTAKEVLYGLLALAGMIIVYTF